MLSRVTNHLRGNLVGYLALFMALGGTSYAAIRLAPGSVTSKALANGAVTHTKLAARSIAASNFAPGALEKALGQLPTGANGAPGSAGSHGPAGPTGAQGPAGADGNASVVLRARSTGSVTAPHGTGTSVPLTGGTWTQGPSDLDLITGNVTLEIPQTCTGSFGNSVVLSIDGIPNTFAVAPTVPANTTVTVPVVVSEVMETGSTAQHSITATVENTCTKSGEDFVITGAKLDVVSFH